MHPQSVSKWAQFNVKWRLIVYTTIVGGNFCLIGYSTIEGRNFCLIAYIVEGISCLIGYIGRLNWLRLRVQKSELSGRTRGTLGWFASLLLWAETSIQIITAYCTRELQIGCGWECLFNCYLQCHCRRKHLSDVLHWMKTFRWIYFKLFYPTHLGLTLSAQWYQECRTQNPLFRVI